MVPRERTKPPGTEMPGGFVPFHPRQGVPTGGNVSALAGERNVAGISQ
jgi:hypothetical protein